MDIDQKAKDSSRPVKPDKLSDDELGAVAGASEAPSVQIKCLDCHREYFDYRGKRECKYCGSTNVQVESW